MTFSPTPPTAVATADLAMDGCPDVIVAASTDSKVSWFDLDCAPEVPIERTLAEVPSAAALAVHDVDGDGDPDVFAAGGSFLAWYENVDRGTTFVAHPFGRGTYSGSIREIRIRDMDEDQDLDVLISVHTNEGLGAGVYWYVNEGGPLPTFSEEVVVANPPDGSWTDAADFSGDGLVDVAAGCINSPFDDLCWFRNLGGNPPSYERRTIDTGGNPSSVDVEDLDLDGDYDILTSRSGYLWYENFGGGLFLIHQFSFDPPNPQASDLDLIDFDGDGDFDFTTVGSYLSWYENEPGPPLTFTSHVVFTEPTPGAKALDVDVKDMDGDGDPDFVAGWSIPNKVAWYENPSIGPGAVDLTLKCSCLAPCPGGTFLYELDVKSSRNETLQIRIESLESMGFPFSRTLFEASVPAFGTAYYVQDVTPPPSVPTACPADLELLVTAQASGTTVATDSCSIRFLEPTTSSRSSDR